jgi:hypothetical protein
MSDDLEARRRARQHWPIRRFELGAEPSEDLSAETTMQERLAMMWPLAVRAWTLAGHDLPRYSRSEMPGRVIRPPVTKG